MFFEQYDHEPNIAVARYLLHVVDADPDPELIVAKQAGGKRALAAMERHLADHDFLVGEAYTVADIALYGYTHVADEAGISLETYPGVARWVERVAAQPGHVTIDSE